MRHQSVHLIEKDSRYKGVGSTWLQYPLALLLTMSFLCGSFATETASAKDLERPIIAALRQATEDIREPTQQIETLAWLSEMSKNLRKRIPNEFYRLRLLRTILDEANRVDLDPQLVMAVIDIESNFNRYAESGAGAQGLMQVMPFWKNELGHRNDDLFNPRINIRYGCEILKHYLELYSPSVSDALAGYNGSLGRNKYPNKVFKRLAKEWNFSPVYSMQLDTVAQSGEQEELTRTN